MTRKWHALLFALLVLCPGRASAQEPAAAWYAGIGSGWYVPIQKWPSSYTLGGGGSFVLGRRFAAGWAAQMDANMWLCSGSGRDTWDIKVTPQLVRTLVRRRVAPFVLTGLGVDYQINYPARTSLVRAAVPIGVGLAWQLHSRSALFLQGIHYVLLGSVTTRDLPVLLGFHADL